ncbi:MAG: hypothetical protein H6658_19480 [Ardenticatenaceae bacterium]|nr:hypothetical protein [Ardenticatenaceae bacterium]
MSVEITLTLPDPLLEQVKQFSSATKRNIETVLIDSLEMMWPVLSSLPDINYLPVARLTDDDVLLLAKTKMDKVQNDRLGALQAKGKANGLSQEEQVELLTLMQIYQLGQLRKSEALAEAVRRGLQKPMAA